MQSITDMPERKNVIISRSNLKTVSFGIALPVGSANESVPGITDIVFTHMLRNTSKYNEVEFAELIDNYGIKTFSDVGRTTSTMGFKVPPQHLEKAVEIFNEIWGNPQFNQETVEKIVQQQIGSLQQIRSTPEAIIANYTKWEVAYGSDPITKHPLGTFESLKQINEENMNSTYNSIKNYSPAFASVGVDVSEQKYSRFGLDDFLSVFGNMSYSDNPITNPKIDYNIKIDTPDMPSSNSYIGINLRGSDPAENKYSEDLFRSVISGGVSARMFTEIREKRNLSYAPRMNNVKFARGSLLTALMDVRPDRAVEALSTTVNLIYDTMTNQIDQDEMERALKIAQRIAVFVSDSSSGYTNFILDRLSTNEEHDLEVIKEKLVETSKGNWQEEVAQLWNKKNVSLAVSGETGEVPQKWVEIIEEVL